jgi:hypothetical protein
MPAFGTAFFGAYGSAVHTTVIGAICFPQRQAEWKAKWGAVGSSITHAHGALRSALTGTEWGALRVTEWGAVGTAIR